MRTRLFFKGTSELTAVAFFLTSAIPVSWAAPLPARDGQTLRILQEAEGRAESDLERQLSPVRVGLEETLDGGWAAGPYLDLLRSLQSNLNPQLESARRRLNTWQNRVDNTPSDEDHREILRKRTASRDETQAEVEGLQRQSDALERELETVLAFQQGNGDQDGRELSAAYIARLESLPERSDELRQARQTAAEQERIGLAKQELEQTIQGLQESYLALVAGFDGNRQEDVGKAEAWSDKLAEALVRFSEGGRFPSLAAWRAAMGGVWARRKARLSPQFQSAFDRLLNEIPKDPRITFDFEHRNISSQLPGAFSGAIQRAFYPYQEAQKETPLEETPPPAPAPNAAFPAGSSWKPGQRQVGLAALAGTLFGLSFMGGLHFFQPKLDSLPAAEQRSSVEGDFLKEGNRSLDVAAVPSEQKPVAAEEPTPPPVPAAGGQTMTILNGPHVQTHKHVPEAPQTAGQQTLTIRNGEKTRVHEHDLNPPASLPGTHVMTILNGPHLDVQEYDSNARPAPGKHVMMVLNGRNAQAKEYDLKPPAPAPGKHVMTILNGSNTQVKEYDLTALKDGQAMTIINGDKVERKEVKPLVPAPGKQVMTVLNGGKARTQEYNLAAPKDEKAMTVINGDKVERREVKPLVPAPGKQVMTVLNGGKARTQEYNLAAPAVPPKGPAGAASGGAGGPPPPDGNGMTILNGNKVERHEVKPNPPAANLAPRLVGGAGAAAGQGSSADERWLRQAEDEMLRLQTQGSQIELKFMSQLSQMLLNDWGLLPDPILYRYSNEQMQMFLAGQLARLYGSEAELRDLDRRIIQASPGEREKILRQIQRQLTYQILADRHIGAEQSRLEDRVVLLDKWIEQATALPALPPHASDEEVARRHRAFLWWMPRQTPADFKTVSLFAMRMANWYQTQQLKEMRGLVRDLTLLDSYLPLPGLPGAPYGVRDIRQGIPPHLPESGSLLPAEKRKEVLKRVREEVGRIFELQMALGQVYVELWEPQHGIARWNYEQDPASQLGLPPSVQHPNPYDVRLYEITLMGDEVELLKARRLLWEAQARQVRNTQPDQGTLIESKDVNEAKRKILRVMIKREKTRLALAQALAALDPQNETDPSLTRNLRTESAIAVLRAQNRLEMLRVTERELYPALESMGLHLPLPDSPAVSPGAGYDVDLFGYPRMGKGNLRPKGSWDQGVSAVLPNDALYPPADAIDAARKMAGAAYFTLGHNALLLGNDDRLAHPMIDLNAMVPVVDPGLPEAPTSEEVERQTDRLLIAVRRLSQDRIRDALWEVEGLRRSVLDSGFDPLEAQWHPPLPPDLAFALIRDRVLRANYLEQRARLWEAQLELDTLPTPHSPADFLLARDRYEQAARPLNDLAFRRVDALLGPMEDFLQRIQPWIVRRMDVQGLLRRKEQLNLALANGGGVIPPGEILQQIRRVDAALEQSAQRLDEYEALALEIEADRLRNEKQQILAQRRRQREEGRLSIPLLPAEGSVARPLFTNPTALQRLLESRDSSTTQTVGYIRIDGQLTPVVTGRERTGLWISDPRYQPMDPDIPRDPWNPERTSSRYPWGKGVVTEKDPFGRTVLPWDLWGRRAHYARNPDTGLYVPGERVLPLFGRSPAGRQTHQVLLSTPWTSYVGQSGEFTVVEKKPTFNTRPEFVEWDQTSLDEEGEPTHGFVSVPVFLVKVAGDRPEKAQMGRVPQRWTREQIHRLPQMLAQKDKDPEPVPQAFAPDGLPIFGDLLPEGGRFEVAVPGGVNIYSVVRKRVVNEQGEVEWELHFQLSGAAVPSIGEPKQSGPGAPAQPPDAGGEMKQGEAERIVPWAVGIGAGLTVAGAGAWLASRQSRNGRSGAGLEEGIQVNADRTELKQALLSLLSLTPGQFKRRLEERTLPSFAGFMGRTHTRHGTLTLSGGDFPYPWNVVGVDGPEASGWDVELVRSVIRGNRYDLDLRLTKKGESPLERTFQVDPDAPLRRSKNRSGERRFFLALKPVDPPRLLIQLLTMSPEEFRRQLQEGRLPEISGHLGEAGDSGRLSVSRDGVTFQKTVAPRGSPGTQWNVEIRGGIRNGRYEIAFLAAQVGREAVLTRMWIDPDAAPKVAATKVGSRSSGQPYRRLVMRKTNEQAGKERDADSSAQSSTQKASENPLLQALSGLVLLTPEEFDRRLQWGTLPPLSGKLRPTRKRGMVAFYPMRDFEYRLFLLGSSKDADGWTPEIHGGVENNRYLIRVLLKKEGKEPVEKFLEVGPETRVLKGRKLMKGKVLQVLEIREMRRSPKPLLAHRSGARSLSQAIQRLDGEELPALRGYAGITDTQGRVFVPLGKGFRPYEWRALPNQHGGYRVTLLGGKKEDGYYRFEARFRRRTDDGEESFSRWYQVGPVREAVMGRDRQAGAEKFLFEIVPLEKVDRFVSSLQMKREENYDQRISAFDLRDQEALPADKRLEQEEFFEALRQAIDLMPSEDKALMDRFMEVLSEGGPTLSVEAATQQVAREFGAPPGRLDRIFRELRGQLQEVAAVSAGLEEAGGARTQPSAERIVRLGLANLPEDRIAVVSPEALGRYPELAAIAGRRVQVGRAHLIVLSPGLTADEMAELVAPFAAMTAGLEEFGEESDPALDAFRNMAEFVGVRVLGRWPIQGGEFLGFFRQIIANLAGLEEGAVDAGALLDLARTLGLQA